MDPVIAAGAAWLRRRHHGLEGYQHDLREQVRRVHPRQRGGEGELEPVDCGEVRAGPAVGALTSLPRFFICLVATEPWADGQQNAQHRSIFANNCLDDSIEPSGYIKWSATDTRINYNTTMAEYNDYGLGFNLTGRIAANITILMNDEQYAPYSSPQKVFQFPFAQGKEGNVGWIDFSV